MTDDELAGTMTELRDKITGSAVSIVLLGTNEPDAKLAVELGMVLLLDRPFVILALPGATVPDRLASIAHAVVSGNLSDADTRAALAQAVADFIPTDGRNDEA